MSLFLRCNQVAAPSPQSSLGRFRPPAVLCTASDNDFITPV